jgi:hypothetical protein
VAWIVHNPVQHKGKPVVGEGHHHAQCAVLAQWFGRGVPHTCHWKPGEQVKGKVLTPGTVIAVFNRNGDYVNRHGFHTALYVGQDKHGIKVIEQFKGLEKIRLHKYNFGDMSSIEKNADSYYVVEHKHGGHGP